MSRRYVISPAHYTRLHGLSTEDNQKFYHMFKSDREVLAKAVQRYPLEIVVQGHSKDTYFRIVLESVKQLDHLILTLEHFSTIE